MTGDVKEYDVRADMAKVKKLATESTENKLNSADSASSAVRKQPFLQKNADLAKNFLKILYFSSTVSYNYYLKEEESD